MRSRGCLAFGASGCVGHRNGLDEAGLARCGRIVDIVEAASNDNEGRAGRASRGLTGMMP